MFACCNCGGPRKFCRALGVGLARVARQASERICSSLERALTCSDACNLLARLLLLLFGRTVGRSAGRPVGVCRRQRRRCSWIGSPGGWLSPAPARFKSHACARLVHQCAIKSSGAGESERASEPSQANRNSALAMSRRRRRCCTDAWSLTLTNATVRQQPIEIPPEEERESALISGRRASALANKRLLPVAGFR